MSGRRPSTSLARSPLLGVTLALVLLGALLPGTLAAGGTPPGTRSGSGQPVVASLRSVPPVSGHAPPVTLPWAHPGGAALLAREKARAAQRGAQSGVQSPAPTTTTGALSAPLTGVPAIDSDQSQCGGCYPPDGAMAVGPSYVVGAVNTAVAVWDKTGKVVIAPVSLPNFLSADPNCPPADGFIYASSDPFVEYDPGANRFVMGMLNFDFLYDSTVCMAVTQTGDPTGQWWIYDFPVGTSSLLFDFPHAAIGSDAIYVTGNLFQNGSTYLGARVYAYDKNTMYSGVGPEQAPSAYHDVTTKDATGQLVDTLAPAKGVGVASTMYFTSVDNCAGCDTVRLWKWSAPFGSNVFTSQGAVTIQPYDQPPDATQLGGAAITTNDTRELGSMWSNGTVYGVHTIGCNPGGGTVDCAQWYQLGNLDGAPSLLQQGIAGTSGQNRFFPTLAVDRSGNLALGYAYSSPSDYAGVRYTGLVAGGTTLEPEQVLVAGQTAITTTGTNGRYGDYGMEAVDPSDGCTVWHLEEYAQSGQLWGTWVGAFKFNGCGATATPDFSLSASPSALSVSVGGSASSTVTLTALNGYSASVGLSVTGPSPLPSGMTATFSPNPVTPTTAGATSTLTVATTSATPAGTYTLTVTGTGTDANSTTHSTTVQFTVAAQDFSLSASPSTQTVTPGGSTTYTVSLTDLNGFSGSAGLSVSGLPAGANAGFSPTSVSSSTPSTLTVTTTAGTTPGGAYTLTITGTSGSLSHQTTVQLDVSDFSLSASSSPINVVAGSSGTSTVTLTAFGGYSSSVTLSVTGSLPSGMTATFSANPVTPTTAGATSTLTIATTSATPAGSYTLTVSGAGADGTTHSTPVTVTVSAPPADFTISVSPAVTVRGGGTATYTVTLTATSGDSGPVTLSVSGQPKGSTVSWIPNNKPSLTFGSATVTLTIKTARTPRGTFNLTITGTGNGGTPVHSATTSLTVTK